MQLRTVFIIFVTLPSDRIVNTAANRALMVAITETEVVLAIRALGRHKIPATDGLGNDFYNYLGSLLVPPSVYLATRSFEVHKHIIRSLEALIIPLRNKGNSDNAMDYRPISLLITGYKVIAKILAMRLRARFMALVILNKVMLTDDECNRWYQ